MAEMLAEQWQNQCWRARERRDQLIGWGIRLALLHQW